ncbi:MAG TPA: hypothetical protein VMV13_13410 [Candidatus Binataceae bacterium]|nr:hypothetical protein [Candidatus Binataceae bacterium]
MLSRLLGLSIPVAFAVALAASITACDPCGSCKSKGTPTATPTAAPNACLPSSSIGVLVQGTDVTAYVPLGNWGGGTAAVAVVPIETSGGIGAVSAAAAAAPTTVTTANVPNSCSSNSTSGVTVCVANNTDVYLINGTTLTSTLTSGATSTEGFSGGSCENCGVVVDSSTNKALVTVGLATGGPGGYQFLDLGATPPAFETPIGAGTNVSEDVSIDPARHLVLSPNESSIYQIVNTSTSTPAIFNNDLSGGSEAGEYDSAAEDCTTGIALATSEGTGNLFLADLTQASFTPGTPGTWTDTGSQLQNFPEFDSFSAGTDGIAVAPGTHLGVVTGEFGGNLEGVIELPSTSGSGIPAAVDYVAFTMPDEPNAAAFDMGFDPHTVTAYVSPNNHKAYAVLGDSSNAYLGIVDLQGLLSAPRTGHTVNSPLPSGVVTYVAQ